MSQPTAKNIPITRIKFPEIKLHTRDGHKLRGYFGNLFKAHSPLLHNHYAGGGLRYKYPEVQYKVIGGIPTLIGINEGAELLPKLFLKIKTIDIDGHEYAINSKNIEHKNTEIGFDTHLHQYEFLTLWMALNQENYTKYQEIATSEKHAMLNRILVGHILGLFRNMELELKPEERLMTNVQVTQKSTNFKENKMIAFSGGFVANAVLPDEIGLGKAASRGFGTIRRK